MKFGTCPKCGSTDVHRALHSGTSNIRPEGSIASTTVYTTHYVCRACGYIEEWVSLEEMPLLKHRFPQP